MIMNMDKITTPKEAKEVLFSKLLQQSGQCAIDEFMSDLRAANAFSERKYYNRLKTDLNKVFEASMGQKSELIKELETNIYDVAKYAR